MVSNLAPSEPVPPDADFDFLNTFTQSRDEEVESKKVNDNNLAPPDQSTHKCLSLESVHEDNKVCV